jgi:hypothetical protein
MTPSREQRLRARLTSQLPSQGDQSKVDEFRENPFSPRNKYSTIESGYSFPDLSYYGRTRHDPHRVDDELKSLKGDDQPSKSSTAKR